MSNLVEEFSPFNLIMRFVLGESEDELRRTMVSELQRGACRGPRGLELSF